MVMMRRSDYVLQATSAPHSAPIGALRERQRASVCAAARGTPLCRVSVLIISISSIMAACYYLGADIGGTNVHLALVDVGGDVLCQRLCRLEEGRKDVDTICALIERNALSLCREWAAGERQTKQQQQQQQQEEEDEEEEEEEEEKERQRRGGHRLSEYGVRALGMGAPGQITASVLVGAANLPGWSNVPLAQIMSDRLGVPAVLINDADAAVGAEAWVGSAKGCRNVAMLTLGTGLGTGIIVDGHLLHGNRGIIEGGHMILSTGRTMRQCGCGQKGCIETLASAKSVGDRARLALAEMKEKPVLPQSSSSLSSSTSSAASVLEQLSDEQVDCKAVFDAAQSGDALAAEIVDETIDTLGLTCINITRILDSEVIILAGGMANAGGYLAQRVEQAFQRLRWSCLSDSVRICLSSVGADDAGVIGCAWGAMQSVQTGTAIGMHLLDKQAAAPTDTASGSGVPIVIPNDDKPVSPPPPAVVGVRSTRWSTVPNALWSGVMNGFGAVLVAYVACTLWQSVTRRR